MQWYYAKDQQRQGPISEVEFFHLIEQGVIGPGTLVWRVGMPNWQNYSVVAPTLVPPLPTENFSVPSGLDETATCVICGQRFPKGEMAEYQGQWVSLQHREEFFKRLRQGASIPGQLNYAGFWIRFLAKVIDFIVLLVCGLLIDFCLRAIHIQTDLAGVPTDPAEMIAQFGRLVPSLAIKMVFGLAYQCFFLSRFAATPGKIALGLKIVRSDGSKLGLGRIVGRYFAEILSAMTLYIGYMIAGIDDQKRALHDYVCDTRVIKARQ